MTVRRFVSFITILAFLTVTSAPALAAEGARPGVPASNHAVTAVQLHQTVQAFNQEAVAARQSLSAFVARADVRAQMSRLGVSQAKVSAQLARLSDADVLRLNSQVMAVDQQVAPAGLTGGQIAWIIVGGCLLVGLIILLAVVAADTDTSYLYY